jgi:hypothetical protein
MKQKLVALLVVSVMVASAFGAIGLSATKVEAQTATTLSLSATRYHPDPGQQYTLSGYLTDSTGGALVGKPIDIWVRHDGDNGILWKTMTTDSNGKYSTTASSTKTAYIRTLFNGDSAYASSRSDLVTVTVRIHTTIVWHVMGGANIFMYPAPTITRSSLPSTLYTMSVNVMPLDACLPLKFYMDGKQIPGTSYCPQTTVAGAVTFDLLTLSDGYHTISVSFVGNNQYYPASLSGTFLLQP